MRIVTFGFGMMGNTKGPPKTMDKLPNSRSVHVALVTDVFEDWAWRNLNFKI